MKIIEANQTFVIAGHMALACDSPTVVELPTKKLERVTYIRTRLLPGDRIVRASDFVQATGAILMRGSTILRPHKQKKTKKHETLNLIKA